MRVRTGIAGSSDRASGHGARDLDCLAARLHGRRSRMAESGRLDALTRIRSLQEFFHALFPETEIEDLSHFQRLLVSQLVSELSAFRAHISGPAAEVLYWGLIRFQVEDLKVLLRICLAKPSTPNPEQYLVPLPPQLELKVQELAGAESIEEFVRLVPKGLLRASLKKALEVYADSALPFFFEAALDRGYFEGILDAVDMLRQEDRDMIRPMVCQEVDMFHLMVVLRGRFHYGLTPDTLRPFHIMGARISRALFAAMIEDSDLSVSAGRVADCVLDAAPFDRPSGDAGTTGTLDAAAIERLAWKRFLRLSNLAFRKSHIGLGVVAGYVGLRRVEVANLITISEGIARGVDGQVIRDHVIAGARGEGIHV